MSDQPAWYRYLQARQALFRTINADITPMEVETLREAAFVARCEWENAGCFLPSLVKHPEGTPTGTLTWPGPPGKVMLDPETPFEGEFTVYLNAIGGARTVLTVTPENIRLDHAVAEPLWGWR